MQRKKQKDKDSGTEKAQGGNIFTKCYATYFKSGEGDSYVDTLLKANAFMRALKFFPALFITVCFTPPLSPIL